MELDIDSFLRSHGGDGAGDDDDDDHSLYHRTVDEILLNHSSSSSSSSSPSPPSSPSTSHRHNYQTPGDRFVNLGNSATLLDSYSQSLRNSRSESLNYVDSRTDSISSKQSSELASTSVLGRSVLPPFFSGVIRSNAKPGAALAAAAAASRSIHTPRAVSIKSSKRTSSGVLERAWESEELASAAPPAGTDNSVASFESSGVSNGSSFETNNDLEGEKKDQFEADQVQVIDGEDESREISASDAGQSNMSEADGVDVSEVEGYSNADNLKEASSYSGIQVESPSRSEKDLIFYESSGSITLNEIENKDFQSLSGDEDNVVSADSSEKATAKETPSSPVYDVLSDEDKTDKADAKHDHENVIPQFKDGEAASHRDESDSLDSTASIIEELVLQRESKSDSTKQKKYQSTLKPLELAEEAEKNQAFTGMHLEEGAAAQPMRLEGVDRGSNMLGYFDVDDNNIFTRTMSSQAFRREHGSLQVLAVHLNYIAVGMSNGSVLVIPSRYSLYHADNMDAKMLILGLQGAKTPVPVTSLCFNQQGDLLFAGYGDGHYTVWDVQKASVLKYVTEHEAPVVHMLYLGQDSQVTRQYSVVSGDAKGVVKLIQFSVVLSFHRISKSKELLNETNSTVVCALPLLSGEIYGSAMVPSPEGNTVTSGGLRSMMGGMVGGDTSWKLFDGPLIEEGVVIFGTHQSALVARLSPKVEIYAQIPRPDGVREGSLPYAAWKCTAESHISSVESKVVETSLKVSLLAIAWDRSVQVAKLVKSELKICWRWNTDSSVVGLAWLDDQILVILTATGQLCMFSKDGNLIHKTSFAIDGSCGDDLVSYHAYFSNAYGNPEKAHHNCIAVRGATVYILRPSQLVVARLLPWKERIEVLHKGGDWMTALNMAMSLYDGQARAVIDLPRHLDDVQKTLIPYLVQLLLSYVDEVFSYMSVASGNQSVQSGQLNELKYDADSVHPDIKEQYTRVGGVAVEFCLHIKRVDVLFDEIFPKFESASHKDTFLELLEPYILKDMLGSLPPEIMQALVEHYSTKGWLQRVEQCVLHMDMLSLDFNQVVRICREHRLHGALIYLFNKGLDDFRTPLEELFLILRDTERESAAALGYKMLVYLKYCFQGLAFPPGLGVLPPKRVPSLKQELIQFLLEECTPNSSTVMYLPYSGPHPNLLYLLDLDTEATLDVLRYAFVEVENNICSPAWHPTNSEVETTEVKISTAEGENLVQNVIDVLSVILDKSYFQTGSPIDNNDGRSTDMWPTRKDIEYILDFIAYFVACEKAKVSKETLRQILEYLTLGSDIYPNVSRPAVETVNRRQKQLIALLEVLPEGDWDAPYLLNLCERAQFQQVCGLIHSIRHQYLAALDSYMKTVDEPIHAFIFIDDMLRQLSGKESGAFKSVVVSRVPDLLKLNREGTFVLIVCHLGEEDFNLSQLRSYPESLFLYLKTLVEVHSTGTLNFDSLRKVNASEFLCGGQTRHISTEVYLETLSNFPKVLQSNPIHLTEEMTELYIELLCKYERKSVLRFLETFESYRVEHCLRLCQEYEIVDAAAFLLERVGDVGSALLLVISVINDKFIQLDTALESELCDADPEHFKAILNKKEVLDILDIVRTCIGLCQRNSPRVDPDESESLWFQLLDSFREPLMDPFHHSKAGYKAERRGLQNGEQGCKTEWKVSKSHRNAHILRKLLSVFIKEIVEGMIGYVRLPRIILKLLSDNESQEFGDFKPTILGMLGTYDFERQILDTAKSLIEDDTYSSMSVLKREASHGFAPRSLLCCICNCPLSKDFSGSSIQVFSCGHAMHLQCQFQENGASLRVNIAGCPICMPRKNSERLKSKSIVAESGLVNNISKSHQMHGSNALHPHENDGFENSYGLHSISRFDLLLNLQKDNRSMQIENIPQLRLAPPAVYHEKVKNRITLSTGESSNGLAKAEKPSRSRQLQDIKRKGSSIRFPLKTNIFGKEKSIKP